MNHLNRFLLWALGWQLVPQLSPDQQAFEIHRERRYLVLADARYVNRATAVHLGRTLPMGSVVLMVEPQGEMTPKEAVQLFTLAVSPSGQWLHLITQKTDSPRCARIPIWEELSQ